MKKHMWAIALVLFSAPAWAKVGTHNFLVNFVLGPAIFYDLGKTASTPPGFGYSVPGADAYSAKAFMGLEVGYLLHSRRASGTIHGMDLRVGIWGELSASGYGANGYEFLNPFLLNFSLQYTPGYQFKSFRLLFDLIGINISLTFAKIRDTRNGSSSYGMLLGYVYTLPLGMHFLFNNGFYFGVRHHIILNSYTVNAYEPPVKYGVLFNIGYAFGK